MTSIGSICQWSRKLKLLFTLCKIEPVIFLPSASPHHRDRCQELGISVRKKGLDTPFLPQNAGDSRSVSVDGSGNIINHNGINAINHNAHVPSAEGSYSSSGNNNSHVNNNNIDAQGEGDAGYSGDERECLSGPKEPLTVRDRFRGVWAK
jgi:hypothetical protein